MNRALLALAAVSAVFSACTNSSSAGKSPATTLPTERCSSHVQADFDPGLESRTVIAGPVAIVPFRVAPASGPPPPVRGFKLAVRLDAKAVATLRTKTAGTSLFFDREAAQPDKVYRLADGAKSVRLSGCPEQSALFVGAVLTTGPRSVELDVITKGRRTPVTITAFGE